MQVPVPPPDDEDEWLRQFVLSEEYLRQHYPHLCGGFYRRFEAVNVIDLVRERRRRRAKLKVDPAPHQKAS